MKKFVRFVFKRDSMCFIHVLLNALGIKAKGYEAKISIEGGIGQTDSRTGEIRNSLKWIVE